jgi:23S rRNA-/tRNA-specific pseudouridylate synthase
MSLPTAELIHDCADFVAVNKPAGVSFLKDRSGAACLWDALPEIIGGKPYQVHRLDKGTSGVLLVARNAEAQKRLAAMFLNRSARKYYLCWLVGKLADQGLIDLPLKKGRKSRYRVAGNRADIVHDEAGWQLAARSEKGLDSQTRIRPLLVGERTLLLAQPKTGRSHQLRVHLSWIGHPIIGDHLYGRPADPAQQADRLQLHCHRLVLPGIATFRAAVPPADWLSVPKASSDFPT